MNSINKKAFTLIELLVVVIIIGILAAIAIPQYQKAVERANVSKVLPLLRSVYDAQQRHFLTYGNYATTFDQLDVDMPWTSTAQSTNATLPYTTDTRSYGDLQKGGWLIHLVNYNSKSAVMLWKFSNKYNAGWWMALNEFGTPPSVLYCVTRSDYFYANGYCQKFFDLQNETNSIHGYLRAYY
jgi:prepilin-type N-terminal cleavage/methylation domain-containing protein